MFTTISVWYSFHEERDQMIYNRYLTHSTPDVILFYSKDQNRCPYESKLKSKFIYFDDIDPVVARDEYLCSVSIASKVDFLKLYVLRYPERFTNNNYILIHDSDCTYNTHDLMGYASQLSRLGFMYFVDEKQLIENYATMLDVRSDCFRELYCYTMTNKDFNVYSNYILFCTKAGPKHRSSFPISFERGNLWAKIFIDD